MRSKRKGNKKLFSLLELICPKLIYFTFNHDPQTLFIVEEYVKITENSINLHLKSEIIKMIYYW
jgi:hypothetical protein